MNDFQNTCDYDDNATSNIQCDIVNDSINHKCNDCQYIN